MSDATKTESADPFQGDLLQRSELAARLTPVVTRLSGGGTIGINAPWGEGKTWFGKAWAAQLRQEGRKVSYIDAFANDFVDDPFLLIAAELASLLEGGPASSAIARRAGGVMRSVAPLAAKALISLASRAVLGVSDLEGEVKDAFEKASESSADAAEKWIEKAVQSFEAEKKAVAAFRGALSAAVAKQPQPVVVFIDELDRCRPSFAVSMLERVKHLFDVPNLVIVLLLNRAQLQSAIRGVYGESFDGAAYLGKFVTIWFDLPNAHANRTPRAQSHVSAFVDATTTSMAGAPIDGLGAQMHAWAVPFQMSLRDVERCCLLCVVAHKAGSGQVTLLGYLAALKIKRPEIFQNIRSANAMAHLEAARWLDDYVEGQGLDVARWPARLYLVMSAMHKSLAGHQADGPAARYWDADKHHLIGDMPPDLVIARLSERLDLPMVE
jgi:hypothetical protein